MDQGNIDDMFSQMLGDLDNLTQQLEAVPDVSPNLPPPPALSKQYLPPPPPAHTADSDEEDADLTAMLDDLCSFEESVSRPTTGNGYGSPQDFTAIHSAQPYHDDIPQLNVTGVPPPDGVKLAYTTNRYLGAEAGEEYSLDELSKDIDLEAAPSKEISEEELAKLSPEEREERIKSEKMRIALEKMKEARIQKLVVKVYNKDDSSKTLMIDERMTARSIMKQLIEKNHYDFSPNWALIEELPSLFLERVFEEHEKPCETMKHWTRDSSNQLRFIERKDKYALFKNPQHYLLSSSDQQDQMQERQKRTLIEEFFSGKGPSSGVPEVGGYLHIKNGKSWSRKYCVLRSSGLYVSKSGEPKRGKKLADLTCLVMFEHVLLYIGRGWKKRFKSPYEYGFALKHPAIQMKSKHIRYLACEDFKSLMRWSVGIRLAKYGSALLQNYEKTDEDKKSKSTLPTMTFRAEPAGTDNASLRSADSGEAASRTGTIPRGVGVKNMFEGAWQRANQTEQSPSEVPVNANRAKSVWKPNQKKSNNWWELQEEDPDSSSLSNTLDSDSTSTSRSLDDLAASLAGSIPPPPVETSLPPPPPAEHFPLPPPIKNDMPPPPLPAAYHSPKRAPPIPRSKPSFYPEESTTFTSYDDPLPPPPPAKVGFNLPPPVPPKKMGNSPNRNFNHNNNLAVARSDTSSQSRFEIPKEPGTPRPRKTELDERAEQ